MNVRTSRDVIKDYSVSVIAKSEKNDCVVKAIAVALDTTYDYAHALAKKELGRKDKDGVSQVTLSKWLTNRNDPVITEHAKDKTLNSLRYPINVPHTTYTNKKTGEKLYCKMTVGTFCKLYNEGRYYILVKGHIFVVVNGEILGTTQDAKKIRTQIRAAWKVK